MYLFLIIKIFYKYKKTRIWKEKNFIIRGKNSEGTLDDFWEKKKKSGTRFSDPWWEYEVEPQASTGFLLPAEWTPIPAKTIEIH